MATEASVILKKRGRPRKMDVESTAEVKAEKQITKKSKAEKSGTLNGKTTPKSKTIANAIRPANSIEAAALASKPTPVPKPAAPGLMTTTILEGLQKSRQEAGLHPNAFAEPVSSTTASVRAAASSTGSVPKNAYSQMPIPPRQSSPQQQIATMSTKTTANSRVTNQKPASTPPTKPTAPTRPPIKPMAPVPAPASTKPSRPIQPVQPPASKPKTKPAIPNFKQLNAMAVDASTNQIKSMASGQRPDIKAPPGLPKGYKRAARRWTALLVSTPLVIMTTWWIWERTVLKKERKIPQAPINNSPVTSEPSGQ